MLQVVEDQKNGSVRLEEVPTPLVRPGFLLVKTAASLVSVGTERTMVEFARKNLVAKALARPDLVRRVIDYAKTEGILEAYRQAVNRLDKPIPLGYSCSGVVLEVGTGVHEFKVGDRVACSGYPYAVHAEVVCVPANLCALIPNNVNLESAAFVMLGAIALHAVRTAEVTLGEKITVIGLGLLGQIAIQILTAAGCHVMGTDVDPKKARMALQHGAEMVAVGRKETVEIVRQWTNGLGADAVLIFASTQKNEPIELAAEIARERARVIVPGLVGMRIPRKIFYEKELHLVVSRSAGPGIYDSLYECKGVDYPLSYVRWTWRRNMIEFLDLISRGRVRVDDLITHRYPIERAKEVYDFILKRKQSYIGVLLEYGKVPDFKRTVDLKIPSFTDCRRESDLPSEYQGIKSKVGVGVIGAGLFASTTLIPAIRRLKHVKLRGLATATGTSASHIGKKFQFEYATSDYRRVLEDPDIDCVFILTRHDLHASLVIEALRAGKHVFVEKPLALNLSELREIARVFGAQRSKIPKLLMVGFNRRYSPLAVECKSFFDDRQEPLVINCRINAGRVASDSWVHDLREGGGRIIGEVCHFVDLIQHLTGAYPTRVYAETIGNIRGYQPSDNIVATIKMSDYSIATIAYTAAGHKSFPRERIEVFGGGAVGLIDNFKSATFIRSGKTRRLRKWNVDRGHLAEMQVFISSVMNGGKMPVPLESYILTTLATFAIEESLRRGTSVPVSLDILYSDPYPGYKNKENESEDPSFD
jgi:predicted dehydrogenase/threonine dehydrogenase-like Zn-dependent dehydrogenase